MLQRWGAQFLEAFLKQQKAIKGAMILLNNTVQQGNPTSATLQQGTQASTTLQQRHGNSLGGSRAASNNSTKSTNSTNSTLLSGSRVYMCRKCGQPKKGHICTNIAQDDFIEKVEIYSNHEFNNRRATIGDMVHLEIFAKEAITTPQVILDGIDMEVLMNSHGLHFECSFEVGEEHQCHAVTIDISGYQNSAGVQGARIESTTDGSKVLLQVQRPLLYFEQFSTTSDLPLKVSDTLKFKLVFDQEVSKPHVLVNGREATVDEEAEVSEISQVVDDNSDTDSDMANHPSMLHEHIYAVSYKIVSSDSITPLVITVKDYKDVYGLCGEEVELTEETTGLSVLLGDDDEDSDSDKDEGSLISIESNNLEHPGYAMYFDKNAAVFPDDILTLKVKPPNVEHDDCLRVKWFGMDTEVTDLTIVDGTQMFVLSQKVLDGFDNGRVTCKVSCNGWFKEYTSEISVCTTPLELNITSASDNAQTSNTAILGAGHKIKFFISSNRELASAPVVEFDKNVLGVRGDKKTWVAELVVDAAELHVGPGPVSLKVHSYTGLDNTPGMTFTHNSTIMVLESFQGPEKPVLDFVTIKSNNDEPSVAQAGNSIIVEFRSSVPIFKPQVEICKKRAIVTEVGEGADDSTFTNFEALHEIPTSKTSSEGMVMLHISKIKSAAGVEGDIVTSTTDGSSVTLLKKRARKFASPPHAGAYKRMRIANDHIKTMSATQCATFLDNNSDLLEKNNIEYDATTHNTVELRRHYVKIVQRHF